MDLQALKARLGPDVAGVMITNPNTCGLFERDMKAISDAVHDAGGFVYCDGANFNAIVGRVRPGDLGVDAMHINLHKTFSTPHGGGGPGSGPVVLSEALSPFMPLPYTARTKDGVVHLIEEEDAEAFSQEHFGGRMQSFGRMTAFHGQMGMFTRALTYILSHGGGWAAPGGRRRGAERQLCPCAVWKICCTPPSRIAGRACTRRCSATKALAGVCRRSILPRASSTKAITR